MDAVESGMLSDIDCFNLSLFFLIKYKYKYKYKKRLCDYHILCAIPVLKKKSYTFLKIRIIFHCFFIKYSICHPIAFFLDLITSSPTIIAANYSKKSKSFQNYIKVFVIAPLIVAFIVVLTVTYWLMMKKKPGYSYKN